MALNAKLPVVTVGGEAYAERAANIISEAFAHDALNRAMIITSYSLSNEVGVSVERRTYHFLSSIRRKVRDGGLLVEAGNWAAVALWIPPCVQTPVLERSILSPLVKEYLDKFSDARKRHLKDQEFWFLDLLGRHPERREPGVIRALLEPYMQRAREAGLPSWLEANTEHARDIYIHFGFRVVEEIAIGEGCVDKFGNLLRGGEGIIIYAMVAEP
ncbi:hypothetical protein ETB97_004926 [Aspergillus alliaceus]|uniref:N-acetyltransferase domain-containing protein n=1 Tax=Petromyces alliaceus TaxID=209559 RepID=A0A8H5ZZF2_PETAA|nr:hypothetical protein ETB97_004926 [Aspergillus burnettii]